MFENILHPPRRSVVHDAVTILLLGATGSVQLATSSALILEVAAAVGATPPPPKDQPRAPIERFVVCVRAQGR